MGNKVEIGGTYDRSDVLYDVVKVIDIIVTGGRCLIRFQMVFGDDPDIHTVGPEDTKNWEAY